MKMVGKISTTLPLTPPAETAIGLNPTLDSAALIVSVVARNRESGCRRWTEAKTATAREWPRHEGALDEPDLGAGQCRGERSVDARRNGQWLEPADLGADKGGCFRRRFNHRIASQCLRPAIEEDNPGRTSVRGEPHVDADGQVDRHEAAVQHPRFTAPSGTEQLRPELPNVHDAAIRRCSKFVRFRHMPVGGQC